METIQRRTAESKLASVQQEHYQLPHSFTGEKVLGVGAYFLHETF